MKHCKHCNIKTKGSSSKCPLCQSWLLGDIEDAEDVFSPLKTVFESNSLFFKILLFILVSISIICLMADIMLSDVKMWSLLVIASCVTVWLSVCSAVKRRGAVHRKIVDLATLICFFAVVYDFLTDWSKIATDYVIPIVLICCMIIAVILAWLFRMPLDKYAVYILILNLMGLIPGIFLLTEICANEVPSFLCVTTSLLSMAGFLIFQWERMRSEINRRLHV